MTASSNALDPTTITAPLDDDADYLTICWTWQHAAHAQGITTTGTKSWDCFTHRDVPEIPELPRQPGTNHADNYRIGGVIGIAQRYYLLINDHGTARAILVPTVNACLHCGLETDLGPDGQHTDYVCSDECGHAHVTTVIDALTEHGVYPHQPHHLDTVWVDLADGSTLHIGDHTDNNAAGNLGLVGAGGYTVWRDLDGEGIGGPDNDGNILDRADATFDEMINTVVAETRKVGQPAPQQEITNPPMQLPTKAEEAWSDLPPTQSADDHGYRMSRASFVAGWLQARRHFGTTDEAGRHHGPECVRDRIMSMRPSSACSCAHHEQVALAQQAYEEIIELAAD